MVLGARGGEKRERWLVGRRILLGAMKMLKKKISVTWGGWYRTQVQLLTTQKTNTQETSVIFDLQHCFNSCCTAKWLSCTYIYTLFFFLSFLFLAAPCRILVCRPGIEPGLPQQKRWTLTTGLPGKSLDCFLSSIKQMRRAWIFSGRCVLARITEAGRI